MASIWKRNGNWRAEVRRRGYPLLTSTFDTKAMAEAWARRIESEMDRGAFVDRTEAERNTLGDLLIRYSKEVSPSKKGGVGEIQRIKVLCTDPLARLKAASLSGKAMAEFRDRRLNGYGTRKKVSGSTVNRELTLIGHVINVARKEWGVHVDVNPVSIIRRPKENRGRSRRLAQTEEARLLAELEPRPRHDHGHFLKGGSRNECARPIVILAIETAMRRGELLSLRWEDVHLDDQFVRLHDTKNGEARDVPLSLRAVATLRVWRERPHSAEDNVFPTSADALKKAFVRACFRAKIDDLHFHDLRHEATSRIAEKLDNILELSAVTGHKTVQMLRRYYHPRAKDLALKLG
ncbi:Tyrosine recombinase XerC [Paraburkholderia nemoris]|uniref:site-specific integrase n=1 Tax=Paraburkholderia nemoris TaxID=2793076 RepID=UPI001914D6C4|nr:site-specific integrase [Paraburkholderia nemoris]MBK5149694.1 site-specific integrase [Burkholderia sp. R-69608]CAE6938599.1 Tyrosine recombinase XerC [Paraburkholderia nemoris]